jgi:hypothetical protein
LAFVQVAGTLAIFAFSSRETNLNFRYVSACKMPVEPCFSVSCGNIVLPFQAFVGVPYEEKPKIADVPAA